MPNLRSLVAALLCAILVAMSSSGWTAPGDLDPTFGSGNVVITDLGNWEDVPVLALQPDGKLVAASSTLILELPYPEAQALPDMAVVRYNDDGTDRAAAEVRR